MVARTRLQAQRANSTSVRTVAIKSVISIGIAPGERKEIHGRSLV